MSITGQQIRMARAALGWSLWDLAEECGVGTATLVRYEAFDRAIPKSRKNNLDTIRKCFELAGLEFVGEPGEASGVIARTAR